MRSYYQMIAADMRKAFGRAGVGNIIRRSYNNIAIDTSMIDCDYYRFLDGDVKAINSYCGEFMINYSWAEFSGSRLNGWL